jgi:hypothetical protein
MRGLHAILRYHKNMASFVDHLVREAKRNFVRIGGKIAHDMGDRVYERVKQRWFPDDAEEHHTSVRQQGRKDTTIIDLEERLNRRFPK